MPTRHHAPDNLQRHHNYQSTKDTNAWLNTQRQHPNYKTHPGIQNHRKTDFAYQQKYRKCTHQTPLTCDKTNDHWGNHLQLNQLDTSNRLRIISRNVNTISNAHQQLSWQAITQAALDTEADIVCLQETNTNWTTPIIRLAGQIFNKSEYRAHRIATTAGKAVNDSNYLPGGTLIAALGRWTVRVTGSGYDTSGLGRWSHLTLQGSNNISYVIVSGY